MPVNGSRNGNQNESIRARHLRHFLDKLVPDLWSGAPLTWRWLLLLLHVGCSCLMARLRREQNFGSTKKKATAFAVALINLQWAVSP